MGRFVKKPALKMDGLLNKNLIEFCRTCHDVVFLQEFPKEFRNGKMHVGGSCSCCDRFIKFVPRNKSLLIQKMKKEGTLEANGFA